jgi:hypothetical protein
MKRRRVLLALLPVACAEPNQPPPVTTAPPAEEPEQGLRPRPHRLGSAERGPEAPRPGRHAAPWLRHLLRGGAHLANWDALPPAKQRFRDSPPAAAAASAARSSPVHRSTTRRAPRPARPPAPPR